MKWIGEIVGARISFDGNHLQHGCLKKLFNVVIEDNLDGGNFSDYNSGDTADGGTFNPWNVGYVFDSGLGKLTYLPLNEIYTLRSSRRAEVVGPIIIAYPQAVYDSLRHDTPTTDVFKKLNFGPIGSKAICIEDNEFINYNNRPIIGNYLVGKHSGKEFHSGNLTSGGYPFLESGDAIRVTDLRNRAKYLYIASVTHSLGGQSQIESIGNTDQIDVVLSER